MNLLASSAIALATAAGSDDGTGSAREWLRLDREVEDLARSAAPAAAGGFSLSAWMKSAWRHSSDIAVGGNDESGVVFQGVRLTAQGKAGPVDVKLSVDGASGGGAGPVSIKDAFARTKLTDAISIQVGNFRAPFVLSGVASDEKEIFFDRSSQGALWNGRELCLMLDGHHGPFLWWLSGQNGGDGTGDDWLTIAKAAYAITGEPIPPKQTGGYGVDSPTRATVGAGFADDRSAMVGDARAFSGEVTLITGAVFAHAEIVDYGDGFVPGSISAGQAKKAADAGVADSTPFGVTVGFMLTPKDEIAVRYDDLDDDIDDTRVYWAGYTRYVAGHATKWQVDWIATDSDAGDVDELLVGLTVSI